MPDAGDGILAGGVLVPGFFLTTFWNDQVLGEGREGIFLVLVGFLVSFGFIRMSTRLMRSPKVPWWPGSVSAGDVHIHHLVFGIVLMLIGATIGYTIPEQSPWWELTALAFGIGAGLTFDEFALWVRLEDVYWAEEGRQSVDAAAIAVIFMGLVFVGAVPFDVSTENAGLLVGSIISLLVVVGTSAVCFLKKRMMHGFVGLFFWPIALYGACRLAKPDSAWARRRYAERNPRKQERSEERYADRRIDRFKQRFRDAVGGAPTAGS
jgi:hypothetical protein